MVQIEARTKVRLNYSAPFSDVFVGFLEAQFIFLHDEANNDGRAKQTVSDECIKEGAYLREIPASQ